MQTIGGVFASIGALGGGTIVAPSPVTVLEVRRGTAFMHVCHVELYRQALRLASMWLQSTDVVEVQCGGIHTGAGPIALHKTKK